MGSLAVPDATGHLTLTWDPGDPASVERARTEFEALKAAGFGFFAEEGAAKPALRLGKTGHLEGRIVRARDFNPEAGRTIATRPMRGG